MSGPTLASSCTCGCGACLRAHDLAAARDEMKAQRDRMKAQRDRRVAAGLCVKCGGQPRPGRRTCLDCGIKSTRGAGAKSLARYHAMKAAGLCRCGREPVSGRVSCAVCLAREADRKRLGRPAKSPRLTLRAQALFAKVEARETAAIAAPAPPPPPQLTPYAQRLIAAREAQGNDTEAFTRIGRSLLSHFRGAHAAATPAKRH